MAAPSTTNEVTVRKLSSVITGVWDKCKNMFQTKLTAQTAYSGKGTATKVPQITTNSLGQVTGITEVTISGVAPASHTHGNIANGGTLTDTAAAAAGNDYVVIRDADNAKIQTSTIKGTDVADAVSKKHSHSTLTLSTTAQAYDGTNTLALPSTDPYTSARTPASHTHGNIANGGTLQTNDITIANGDKLVVTDVSDSNKVARTSVSFDGSTTTAALTKKGTFESFQAPLTAQTAYTSKGTATKVPQITTNSLGQVTGITEVDITASDAATVGPYSAFASTAAAFGFSRLGTVIFSSSAKKGLMTFRVHASRGIKDVYILNGEFGRDDRGGVTSRFTTQGPGDPAYKLYYKDVSDSTNPKYEIWFVDVANTGALERRVRIELISIDISGFDRNFTSQQTNPGSLTAFWRSTFDAYINWKFIDYETMSWNGTDHIVYQSIGYSAARGTAGTTTTLLISNGDSGGVQGTYLVRFLYRNTPIVQYKQLFGVTSDRGLMEFGYYISGDYAYLTVCVPKWASQRPIHVISLDDNFVFARGSATSSAPSGYVAGTEQGFSSLADKGDGDGNNRVFAHWTGNNVTSVTPSSSQARTGTKWLVAGYTESDGTHFNVVDVNNVTVKNAQQINGYNIIVGQLGTSTGTIYFV